MKKKYEVLLPKNWLKELKRIAHSERSKIEKAALDLENNPRPYGYIKLSGHIDLYRIVVGNYRIIYKIEDDQLIVLVLEMRDRKSVYKNR